MKRTFMMLLLFIFAVLTACSSNDNNENDNEPEALEMNEDEKIIVNIDQEEKHLEEIYELTDSLTPEETESIEDGLKKELYEPSEYMKFTLPEGNITEVAKTIEDGEGVETITIDYMYKNHRIIIDYDEDGYITKSVLNQKTGEVLVNENDEDYMKFQFEELEESSDTNE